MQAEIAGVSFAVAAMTSCMARDPLAALFDGESDRNGKKSNRLPSGALVLEQVNIADQRVRTSCPSFCQPERDLVRGRVEHSSVPVSPRRAGGVCTLQVASEKSWHEFRGRGPDTKPVY